MPIDETGRIYRTLMSVGLRMSSGTDDGVRGVVGGLMRWRNRAFLGGVSKYNGFLRGVAVGSLDRTGETALCCDTQ